MPASFDCYDDKYLIIKSEVLKIDSDRDIIRSLINDLVTSIFFAKGPEKVLKLFDSLLSLRMENLIAEAFRVGLEDFFHGKGWSTKDFKGY